MHFRGVWPGNSVCVKLPRLEPGSAPVPGFGAKQVVGIQQHLSIELLVFLWGRLLCSCTPGAVCLCFYGEWVQVLSRSCETQQCCSIERALTDTGLSFLCCLVYLVYVKKVGAILREYRISLSCLYCISELCDCLHC